MWQYWSHFKYIVKHKWYVFVICAGKGIVWRGITHDVSKFLPSEFFPYANYFFHPDGTRRDLKNNAPLSREHERFTQAWCLHTRRNDHHWEFWNVTAHGSGMFLEHDCVIPPLSALIELVSDMVGASAAQGNGYPVGGARDYYLASIDRIKLHPVARMVVETMLGVVK